MKPPVFRPAAAADVQEAYRWYEIQRVGLGEEFLGAVTTAIQSVLANPQQFPVVHRQTRRVLLRRFPYGLYYRLVQEQVVVVACMHARRDPRRSQSRT